MRNKIALIVLAMLPILSIANDLKPLSIWMKETPKWASDNSEIAYMTARCGVAFATMAAYFQGTNQRNDKNIADQIATLNQQSEVYLSTSIMLSEEMNVKESFFSSRLKMLAETYSKDIVKNKTLHNYAFSKNFEDDINVCTKYYKGLFGSTK